MLSLVASASTASSAAAEDGRERPHKQHTAKQAAETAETIRKKYGKGDENTRPCTARGKECDRNTSKGGDSRALGLNKKAKKKWGEQTSSESGNQGGTRNEANGAEKGRGDKRRTEAPEPAAITSSEEDLPRNPNEEVQN